MSKIIYRNLNGNARSENFFQYTKEQIASFVKNPAQNEKQLRDAVISLYNSSSHFRRLIKYFAGLSDFSYVISPISYNPDDDLAKIQENYHKTATLLSGANLKSQGDELLTVCFREDVYYCTALVTKDTISFLRLNPDYCKIASREGNVFNVDFDFSYFDAYSEQLELYPQEFQTKYKQYQKDTQNKWIQLDAPYSFAIKCNKDAPTYASPPFAGILREVYDLADYKDLKLARTELENYALLVMKLGLSNGEWEIDFEKAKEFWSNLDSVLPEQVGSVLSPMEIEKIGFDKSGTAETDKIAESEKHLWAAAGVSGQLFSGDVSTSRSLEISVLTDQAFTYSVVQDFAAALNRILQKQSFSKNFAISFLNTSYINRESYAKLLMSTIQYGFPTINMIMSTLGIEPLHTMGLNFLETDVLNLSKKFIPLKSANTVSKSDLGAPEKDGGDLSDEGERSRDKA